MFKKPNFRSGEAMRMVGFQVTNYRSVIDSRWIKIDDLTVLVGKNESGKTSLSRALHKFKPFIAEDYDIDREWPRGHRQTRSRDVVVCSVGFVLESSDHRTLGQQIGRATGLDGEFVIRKTYGGNYVLDLDPNRFPNYPTTAAITAEISKLNQLVQSAPPSIKPRIKDVTRRLSANAAIGDLESFAKSDSFIKKTLLPQLPEGASTPPADAEFVDKFIATPKEVGNGLRAAPTIRKLVEDHIKKSIPTFIYMDDYRAFRGTALLDQVKSRKDQNTSTDEDKTLLTLWNYPA
jgi:hypothetical protein